jgi:hypothetical protein
MGEAKVVMLMRAGRERLLDLWKSGQAPSDFLYGFCEMGGSFKDLELQGFRYQKEPSRHAAALWKRLNQAVSYFFLCQLHLGIICSLWRSFKQGSVVVTNIDSIGLSVASLRFLFPDRIRQVHISQGLTNALDEDVHRNVLPSEPFLACVRRNLTGMLLGNVEQVVVLGAGAERSMRKHRLLNDCRLHLIQYGIDPAFWSRTTEGTSRKHPPFILSVGSDAGRDYETLLKCSFSSSLRIVSRLKIPTREGVSQQSDLGDQELRDLYSSCEFVVIPLRDIPQPSGQSACLQAMACGKAVIIAKTTGFWEDSSFRDGENLFFVKPYDSKALQDKIQELEQDQSLCHRVGMAARALVSEKFTIHHFASRLGELVEYESRIGSRIQV